MPRNLVASSLIHKATSRNGTHAMTHKPPTPHESESIPRDMTEQAGLLRQWAARYIWWKSPEEALRYPARILAQVMNIGDYEDVQRMVDAFGDEALREVMRHAEAGQLNERSWAYWHYRLGLASPGEVPPLPTRRLA